MCNPIGEDEPTDPVAYRHVWEGDVPSGNIWGVNDGVETTSSVIAGLSHCGRYAVDFFMPDGSRVRVRRRHPVSEFPRVG